MTFPVESSYCDTRPMKARSQDFQDMYFPDIEKVTNGSFSLAKLLGSTSILDIGCGSGALADALRKKGYKGKLVGIDSNGPYPGDTAYSEYEELLFDDVRSDSVLKKIEGREFDNAICVGLPPQACDFILQNPRRFKLKKDGILIVVTDDMHENPQGLNKFQGEYSADRNIFLFRS